MIDETGFRQQRQSSFRIVFPGLHARIVAPERRRAETVDLNRFALGRAFDDVIVVDRLRNRLADANIAEQRVLSLIDWVAIVVETIGRLLRSAG